MTQRERHTPDGGPTTGPRPAAARPASAAPPAPDDRLAPLWEQWYERASPDQRRDLLLLAGRQGVVYGHQLTPPANGAPRPLWPALLAGQLHDLQPLRPPPLTPQDAELDAAQQEAVARAVHTPDVCLIQGYPGTGKSRVTAEVIAQASTRGQRVLLLAPTPAALDRVLERLGGRETLCPVRCLGPEESLDALAPCVRRLTLAERARFFEEQTLPAARSAAEAARRTLEDRRGQEGAWDRLEELAGRLGQCAREAAGLEEQIARVAAEVDAELGTAVPEEQMSPPQRRWADCVRLRDEALALVDGRLAESRAEAEKVRAERDQLDARREQLRPMAEAREGGRWWTGSWWKAVLRGNVRLRSQELERRRDELQQAGERLDREVRELTAERARAEERAEAERRSLVEGEAGRRRAALEARLAALAAERGQLEDKWQAGCKGLGPPTPPSASPEAVRAAREAWRRQLEEDGQQAQFAREWEDAVEEALQTLPGRLAGCANVVAATTAALAGDVYFGDGAAATFDLLVLEEAHEVTESEFLKAAPRARRWVLVGAPAVGPADGPGPVRLMRPAHLRPGFFGRLWHHLHADPRRLPYAWFRREGRLICRLRPIPPGQERWVECEPVADRPEVELRIVSPPRGVPELVEVIFPDSVSIHEAKEYVYRELEELPVQGNGPALRWVEQPEQVLLHLGAPDPAAAAVPLAAGVWEMVGRLPGEGDAAGGVPWYTSALRFDRAAGWDRERAERWVEEHLRLRDLGRTALLATPHRPQPALAAFLSDLLFEGAYQLRPGWRAVRPALLEKAGVPAGLERAAVEFVAVPSLGAESRPAGEESGWGGGGATAVAQRPRSVRGGAGLETDLADPRRLEVLPDEVRAALPRQGLVNYPEARAVVRALEALVTDPAFRAAGEAWQRQRAADCEQAGEVCDPRTRSARRRGHSPTVAVIGLYPAQAELIGLLMQRVPALAASPVEVEVGLPADFEQRECLAALVSLTRSHSHRAVTYGDGPPALVRALTRPASHLVLFGDPGTLVRRSQWQGPLDHLDEAAARHERGLAARLVGYIQGRGAHPQVFRFHERGA